MPVPRWTALTTPGWRTVDLQLAARSLVASLAPGRVGPWAVQLRLDDPASVVTGGWLEAVAPLVAAGADISLNVGGTRSPSDLVRMVETIAPTGIACLQLPERAARPLLWRRALDAADRSDVVLSCSCHSGAGVDAALAAGADRVFVSPVFATPSKPGAAPLGLDAFGAVARRYPGRVIALGGIDVDTVAPVFAQGAAGVACIRAAWDETAALLSAACRLAPLP